MPGLIESRPLDLQLTISGQTAFPTPTWLCLGSGRVVADPDITLRWQPVNRLQDTLGSHVEGTAKSRSRFDSDSVIDRRRDSLLAAQVAFRRLNGDMPQKELYLLRGRTGSLLNPALIANRRIPMVSFPSPSSPVLIWIELEWESL